MRISLIDADSIVYIVSWNHKDSEEMFVLNAVDSIVEKVLSKTKADAYAGFLSCQKASGYRNSLYKFAPYKGHRGTKPAWVLQWEGTIRAHLKEKWGFREAETLEADDWMGCYPKYHAGEFVFCSPDKDIRQLPGLHFNYKQMESEVFTVSPEEALNNWAMLMLCGDAVDNIKGIPGMGVVKAEKLLKTSLDQFDTICMVSKAYVTAFGEYYGPEIYNQTSAAVRLDFLFETCEEKIREIMCGYTPTPVPLTDLDLPNL